MKSHSPNARYHAHAEKRIQNQELKRSNWLTGKILPEVSNQEEDIEVSKE